VVALLAVALSGCGDSTVQPQGAVCTPDQSVDPKNCTIEPRNPNPDPDVSTSVTVSSESDLRRICDSPCTKVDSLNIDGLNTIENLGALSRLERIGSLTLRRLENLKSLEGIQQETEIGGLTIELNQNLETLDGLADGVTIGAVAIIDNHNLDSLAGIGEHFKDLSRLEVRFNKLERFGLQKNIDVAEDAFLSLQNESRVQNFEGLEGLTKVSVLYQGSMDSLTSFQGLGNLQTVTDGLTITNNDNLAPCRVNQFVNRVSTPNTDVETFANGGSAACN
jgi:hypothetical protein